MSKSVRIKSWVQSHPHFELGMIKGNKSFSLGNGSRKFFLSHNSSLCCLFINAQFCIFFVRKSELWPLTTRKRLRILGGSDFKLLTYRLRNDHTKFGAFVSCVTIRQILWTEATELFTNRINTTRLNFLYYSTVVVEKWWIINTFSWPSICNYSNVGANRCDQSPCGTR